MLQILFLAQLLSLQDRLFASPEACQFKQQFYCSSVYIHKLEADPDLQRVAGPSGSASVENMKTHNHGPESCVAQVTLNTEAGKFVAQYFQSSQRIVAWLDVNGKPEFIPDSGSSQSVYTAVYAPRSEYPGSRIFFTCRSDE